jgi:hypothetical protein
MPDLRSELLHAIFGAFIAVLLKTQAFWDAYAELPTFGRIIIHLSSGQTVKMTMYYKKKDLFDCSGLKLNERKVGDYQPTQRNKSEDLNVLYCHL